MSEWWIMILGMVAGLLTTGSFVPQVIKAWRGGDTNAISLRMYLVMTAAFALWLGYGLVIGSWPIIVFNVCNLVLSAVILWLKLQEGSAERRQLVWWAVRGAKARAFRRGLSGS
jgi:MtN3 and saliva related transmembrane protein